MTIVTKANIGDRVWFMSNDKCQSGILKRINIEIENKLSAKISYTASYNTHFEYHGSEVFTSKEELLKSL